MKVLVYRVTVSEVEVPEGMFTWDSEGRLPANEVFNYLGDNDIELEREMELEEAREVVRAH